MYDINMVVLLLACIPVCLYMLPSLLAHHRSHEQFKAILILNICLGWTLLGWVGALVWAYIVPSKRG